MPVTSGLETSILREGLKKMPIIHFWSIIVPPPPRAALEVKLLVGPSILPSVGGPLWRGLWKSDIYTCSRESDSDRSYSSDSSEHSDQIESSDSSDSSDNNDSSDNSVTVVTVVAVVTAVTVVTLVRDLMKIKLW